MKITFILPSFPRLPVGGYKVVYEYANHLVVRGHEVKIVHCRSVKGAPPCRNFYLWLRTHLGYLYRKLTKPVPSWQQIDPRVKMLFVPEPVASHIPDGDVVFATVWNMTDYLNTYPNEKGSKCYLYQHYETWSGPKDKVDASWTASFHKVVISMWLYEIGKSLGAGDMTYIPNGLDHNKFKLIHPIEDRAPIVSMMFSHQEWKGADDGLQALQSAKKEQPELQAVFFGLQKPDIELPSWIRFELDPTQGQLLEIYNRSAIFICPSHLEGFALPPAEAMACGAAVAATDCGGIRDFAEDGITALLSKPKDPQTLAQNIIRLMKDEEFRVELAKNGKKRVKSLTWQDSADKMEEFLTELVQSK